MLSINYNDNIIDKNQILGIKRPSLLSFKYKDQIDINTETEDYISYINSLNLFMQNDFLTNNFSKFDKKDKQQIDKNNKQTLKEQVGNNQILRRSQSQQSIKNEFKFACDEQDLMKIFNNDIFLADFDSKSKKPHVKRNFVIYPSDTFLNIWNLVILVSLLYLFLVLPLGLTEEYLEEDIPLFYWLNYVSNQVFIVDISINFYVAQQDLQSNLIDIPHLIWINQLKSWFFIDIVSSIPIELILSSLEEEVQEQVAFLSQLKQFKMLRLLKVSRMLRIFSTIEQSDFYRQLQAELGKDLNLTIRLIKSTALLIVVCHFLSTMQVRIAQDNPEENWWQSIRQSQPDKPDTKIEMQITAWYWAIQTCTTVGYGDVPSPTSTEKIFKLVSMLIGVIVFSDFVSSITFDSSSNEQDEMTAKYKHRVEQIRRKQNLDAKSSLILDKVVTKSRKVQLRDDYNLIKELPADMLQLLMQNIRIDFEKRINLFHNIDQAKFDFIFPLLKLIGFSDAEPIQSFNNKVKGVYWIQTGKVGFKNILLDKYNILAEGFYKFFNVGERFGLEDCIFTQTHSTDVWAYEATELMILPKIDLITFMEEFNLLNQVKEEAMEMYKFIWRSRYATQVIINFFYYRMMLPIQWVEIDDFIHNQGLKTENNLNYHVNNVHFGANSGNWWQSIIGDYQDKWINQMGSRDSGQIVHRLEFDLARFQDRRQHRSQRLRDFQNMEDQDTKSTSMESSDAEQFGSKADKTKNDDNKVNVGMIRVKKKSKRRRTDEDAAKAVDDHHELESDVMGTMHFIRQYKEHRKVNDYLDYCRHWQQPHNWNHTNDQSPNSSNNPNDEQKLHVNNNQKTKSEKILKTIRDDNHDGYNRRVSFLDGGQESEYDLFIQEYSQSKRLKKQYRKLMPIKKFMPEDNNRVQKMFDLKTEKVSIKSVKGNNLENNHFHKIQLSDEQLQ